MRGTFNGKQGVSPISASRPVILASLLLSALVGCNSLPSETQGNSLTAGVYGTTDAAAISTASMQGLDVAAQPAEVTAGGSTTLSTTVLERSTRTDSRSRVRAGATTTTWHSVSADALVQIVPRAGSMNGMTYTPPSAEGTYWVVARIASESLIDSVAISVAPAAQPVPVIVAIAPRQPSLVAGAQQQFATTARWADAVTRPFTMSYSATGGTVSSTGLFTAGSTPGTYRVIGTCSCGGADTATVSVTAPVTLASLSITPSTVSLRPNATQQFSVSGTMSNGAPANLSSISFTVSGGSISVGGLFAAPPVDGSYRVVVSTDGSPLRDTSVVTVSSEAAVPFFQDSFDNGTRNSSNGFVWSSQERVTVGSGLAYSGAYALRFTYGPDAPGADSFSEQRFNLGRYLSEVWIEYMLYVPSNFKHRADGGPTNNKLFTLWRDVYSDPNGTWRVLFEYNRLTSSNLDPDFSKLKFSSSRWDLNASTDEGLQGVAGQYSPLFGGSGVFRLGAWNRVRVHVKAASSRSASDGVAQLWINDRLTLNYTEGRFHNFNSTPADAVLRNGYFMGWANSGFTAETVFAIDDVKFYSANPAW